MDKPQDIAIADFDYELPDERIAKFPLACRDQSKLLVFRQGEISEDHFLNIANHLPGNSLLVFNNTKVIHARLLFRKSTGATIEIFCLEPHLNPVATAFEAKGRCRWVCLVGNNKRWKGPTVSRKIEVNGKDVLLEAERIETIGESWLIEFRWDGVATFAEVIEQAGVIPLPPYLHREAEKSDDERYQTIYAVNQGSVAAPTAGLHFTDRVFASLERKNIQKEFITLHVGAGTFKPVSSSTIGEHEMHVEQVEMSRANIEHMLNHFGKPIIAVGTTSVRTIESVFWFGVALEKEPNRERMHINQWDPYMGNDIDITPRQAYENVLHWMDRQGIDRLHGETQLMIAPGYKYHVVDALVTNFHQPKSTLLLLVSALIGNSWRDCYRYALDHGFRFLSYGDSCLFIP